MASALDKIEQTYFEKATKTKTWSGLPLAEFYGEPPPGEYPFTRGIHRNMYRGRLWSRRAVCGYGTGKDTNKRLRFLIGEGNNAPDVIFDIPTMTGLDSDHPMVKDEVGVQGTAISRLQDMRDMVDGLPIDGWSLSVVVTSSAAPVVLSNYLAVAEGRGIPITKLRGTIQNDPLHHRFCGYTEEMAPAELALHTAVDCIEFCTRHMPLWYPMNVNAYDLRENGLGASQEIGYSMAMAVTYIEGALKRGLAIDDFAPRIAFYCSAHIDFFEEIAKLRAMRRMWAKLMRERYKARNPKSWQFKFGIHTAGCSIVSQQPLNNVVRIAYEALAAVLGGAQSIHCCAYDEAIALPTEESARLAIRTQQILAYETGVANVADPLGGSRYIEDLTDRLEGEASKILAEIENRGGMVEAIKSGWVQNEMDKASAQYQREVESGERKIVGVNVAAIDSKTDTRVKSHRASPKSARSQIAALKKWRKSRSNEAVARAIGELRKGADKRENLIPYMTAAVKAGATLGETLGTVRLGFGRGYDPLGKIRSPF